MSSVRKPNKEQEAVKQELQKWCKVIDQYRLQVDNTGVPEDIEEVVSFVLTPVPNTTIMVLSLSVYSCLLYTSPSPRDPKTSRMPSSA